MGKGGSTTTTQNQNYDPVSSAKMAEIAERQQGMAEEQWQMYKDYFQEYEIETANANRELLPFISENAKAQLNLQTKEATAQGPVSDKFYQESLKGVDVNRRMDEAGADVVNSMKLGEGARRREASRYGIDPGSTAFGNSVNMASLETAKGVAGARASARNQAEQENYGRLGLAVGKPTGQITTVNNADPYARAAGTYSGAASTYAPLATRVLSTSKETPDAGFMGFFGNVLGQGAGAYAGAYGAKMGGG